MTTSEEPPKIGGDTIGQDKVGGDKVAGDKITIIYQDRPAPEEAPMPGKSPYMGLQYFDTGDADLFFGREALTAKLVARLKQWHFMAVVGASGSGKSSLVRAGLVPAVQSGEALIDGLLPPQGSERWRIRVITPTAYPIKELAACLTSDLEAITATTTLMDDLMKDSRCLDIAVSRTLKRVGGERLLLVVDQFEELFTLCREPRERAAFIDNLIAATETAGQAIVVITLRADFYHHCAQYERLRGALAKYQEYIGAMSEAELRQAIEGPAERNGWAFEQGLVDLMLRDVGQEPGALPLLSHALLETWKRRAGKTMTLAGYQAAGGVRGAIAQTAESVYRELSAEKQAIARDIFLRLTELGEGAQDTRRRAALDELVPAAEKRAAVEEVLKTLADTRLITMHEDCAEVAHEALIREWPALRGWLEEDRENLRLHRHLGEAAQSWQRAGCQAGDLYRQARLAGALEWARRHANQISALEAEFLRASQREEQRQALARRQRWVGAATLVALLALVVALALTGRFNRLIYRPLLMEWASIPAGEFLMGSTDGGSNEGPQHAVYLDEFEIMVYEVTNAQYAQCVKAGVCLGTGSSSDADTESAAYPVNSVNWHDARAFCEWVGGRLPSEAEWEKAARGGLEGKQYPWGDEPPVCTLGAPNGALSTFCEDHTLPVGSFGSNGYGLYDMAGNVAEWVEDWYGVYPGGDPEISNFSQDNRVVRGGSWYYGEGVLRCASRDWWAPDHRDYDRGFRCARSP